MFWTVLLRYVLQDKGVTPDAGEKKIPSEWQKYMRETYINT